MPSVKVRYLKWKAQPEPQVNPDMLDAMLENYDRALSHPNAADFRKLRSPLPA